MKIKSMLLFLTTVLVFTSVWANEIDQDLTRKIDIALKEISIIRPGMNRGDLEKILTTEGGLSNRFQRTFVYKKCPYIKVDVEFEWVQKPENLLIEDRKDSIHKISKPYLQYSITD